MMSKIVCVAGGLWQKPWIEYLKYKGNYVAVINPVETAATHLADYHIKADVNDIDTINQHIDIIKPSFITSDQSDVSTMIVAVLSKIWNLPSNPVDSIMKLTDKMQMYELSQQLNIPAPSSAEVKNVDDIMQFGSEHGYPIIIKPVDSTMSRGFRKIDTPELVNDELFNATKRFSKSGKVIAQVFVHGDMVTLEGVCSGGKHRTIAVSKKDGFFCPGINRGVRYPYDTPLVKQIIEANDLYIHSSGMIFGLTHSEYVYNHDGYHLIEIGGRGGGAGITNKIVPWVSGVDVYDVLYRSLMGEQVDVYELNVMKRPALLRYYTADQVYHCTEAIADMIRRIPGVADFNYNFAGKQYVYDQQDVRHSMAILLSNTQQQLEMLESQIHHLVNPND